LNVIDGIAAILGSPVTQSLVGLGEQDAHDYLHWKLTRLLIITAVTFLLLTLVRFLFARIARRAEKRTGASYELSGAYVASQVARGLSFAVVSLAALQQVLHTFGFRFFEHAVDEWMDDAQEFLHIKVPHLLIAAAVAFILMRLLGLGTARMVYVAERHAADTGRVSQVKTVAGVFRATGITLILLITGLQVLEILGVNLAPLLASAGVAGIAIGLAAQTIVKDVLNGVLILIEDQYKVGDVVRLAGVTGTVEAMTLRKTTVRDNDGVVYVIPNSQISLVGNQSRDFSVATVQVSVDFSANPDRVLALLKETAMSVREDPLYKEAFLDDPKVLGVDAIRGSELVYSVVFKTKAAQQFLPVREFRRRVRLALEENGMLPGDPNRVFHQVLDKAVAVVAGNAQRRAAAQTKPADDPTKTE
jgi:small conductance mechanosensitive channel